MHIETRQPQEYADLVKGRLHHSCLLLSDCFPTKQSLNVTQLTLVLADVANFNEPLCCFYFNKTKVAREYWLPIQIFRG